MTTTNKEFAEATFGENATLPTTAVAVMEEQNNAVQAVEPPTIEILDFGVNEHAKDLIASLDESNQETIEITASYLDFENGGIAKIQRLIYVGSSTRDYTDEDTGVIEKLRFAYFIDVNKKKWFTQATIIVNELLLVKAPAPVEIEFLGKKKGKNGFSYHTFAVRLIKPVQQLKA